MYKEFVRVYFPKLNFYKKNSFGLFKPLVYYYISNIVSISTKVLGINMVYTLPLDYLHLYLIGVVNKFL